MPAANQGLLGGATVRMRSTGLAQSAGGAGTSTSSIRKSPLGSSATPTTAFVLRSVKGATASDLAGRLDPANNVALHDLGGGRRPHGAGDGDDSDYPLEGDHPRSGSAVVEV